ncbi:MAG: hypothetical protein AB8H79_21440, partial [Myxococcota bacterium]
PTPHFPPKDQQVTITLAGGSREQTGASIDRRLGLAAASRPPFPLVLILELEQARIDSSELTCEELQSLYDGYFQLAHPVLEEIEGLEAAGADPQEIEGHWRAYSDSIERLMAACR